MTGRALGARRRFSAIGIVLCLLAVAFAIEAKVAWFSPRGSAPAMISAAKLQPADAPRQVAQVLAAPGLQHFTFTAPPLLLISLLVAPLFVLRRSGSDRHEKRVFGCPGYFPSLFLRPPPQL